MHTSLWSSSSFLWALAMAWPQLSFLSSSPVLPTALFQLLLLGSQVLGHLCLQTPLAHPPPLLWPQLNVLALITWLTFNSP